MDINSISVPPGWQVPFPASPMPFSPNSPPHHLPGSSPAPRISLSWPSSALETVFWEPPAACLPLLLTTPDSWTPGLLTTWEQMPASSFFSLLVPGHSPGLTCSLLTQPPPVLGRSWGSPHQPDSGCRHWPLVYDGLLPGVSLASLFSPEPAFTLHQRDLSKPTSLRVCEVLYALAWNTFWPSFFLNPIQAPGSHSTELLVVSNEYHAGLLYHLLPLRSSPPVPSQGQLLTLFSSVRLSPSKHRLLQEAPSNLACPSWLGWHNSSLSLSLKGPIFSLHYHNTSSCNSALS